MKKYAKYIYSAVIVIGIIVILFNSSSNRESISDLTDMWIKNVTINNDPDAVYNMFCSDGNLLGTVSQTVREGRDILNYFKFFTALPNIKVLKKDYRITSITSDVYINTAFITWMWDGLDEPIVARMSFIFRNNCIYQLHSSALPDINEDLRQINY